MFDDLIPDQMCLIVFIKGGVHTYCSIERNNFLHQYQYISDNLFCASGQCLFWESTRNITFMYPNKSGSISKESAMNTILNSAIEKGFEYVPLSVGMMSHRYYNGGRGIDLSLSDRRVQITEYAPRNRYKKHKLKQTQRCIQKLNNLSSEVLKIQDEISRINSMCFVLETTGQLKTCIYLKNNLIYQIKKLVQSIESEDDCFSENQIYSFTDVLKNSLQNLNMQYTALVQSAASQINEYKNLNSTQCTAISSKLLNMFDWFKKIRISSFLNHTYMLNQSLSAIKVLHDYITVQAGICTAGAIPENEQDKKRMKEIQSTQIKAKDILEDSQEENKEASSEEFCQRLKDQSGIHLNLCGEPLHNPSWAYSVHYHQIQQIKNGVDR